MRKTLWDLIKITLIKTSRLVRSGNDCKLVQFNAKHKTQNRNQEQSIKARKTKPSKHRKKRG